MLPLIKVLEAPPPKAKIPVNDYDTEEEKEEGEPEHVGNVSGHDINQECMMTSFFIAEGGGRACNCQKFETGRISRVY